MIENNIIKIGNNIKNNKKNKCFFNNNFDFCIDIDNKEQCKQWSKISLNLSKSKRVVKLIEKLYKWYKLGYINANIIFNVDRWDPKGLISRKYGFGDNNDVIQDDVDYYTPKWVELIYKSFNFVINKNRIKDEYDYDYPFKEINEKDKIVNLNDRISMTVGKGSGWVYDRAVSVTIKIVAKENATFAQG